MHGRLFSEWVDELIGIRIWLKTQLDRSDRRNRNEYLHWRYGYPGNKGGLHNELVGC